jgi:hypothetical protein
LRKQRHDFKKRSSNTDHWYDPEFDKDLIEASFATQYGIRLRQEPDISYPEWARLLSGLMPETPLGKVVQIRMEKDPKILRNYGSYEKQVRSDWALFKASKKTKAENHADIVALQEMLKKLFLPRG